MKSKLAIAETTAISDSQGTARADAAVCTAVRGFCFELYSDKIVLEPMRKSAHPAEAIVNLARALDLKKTFSAQ